MGELAEPPFRGIVETTQDALLLLEAARRGIIPRVSRRFTEKERNLIQSGSIFIFHEEESKIKRWTDGLVWSPSRILGNFLIYRELEKRDRTSKNMSFSDVGSRPSSSASATAGLTVKTGRPTSRSAPMHEVSGGALPSPSNSPTTGSQPTTPLKPSQGHVFALGPDDLTPSDTAAHRSLAEGSSSSGAGGLGQTYPQGGLHATPNGLVADAVPADGLTATERRERKLRERQLVGSLTASFRFKEKGLIKKTMSMTINGYSQHLVSYYNLDDALCGRLRSPSTLPELSSLEIGGEFLDPEHFRFPPKVQIGPDGLLRYRGEPDMQETTPDDIAALKPLPAAKASSSRRRSQPPAVVATGPSDPSPIDIKSSSGRPSSSLTRPGTASTRPPTASSSSSCRPLSPLSYPSGAHQDAYPAAPVQDMYARRPSSPTTMFGSAPASASYQARTGRMFHPYAANPADFGDGPRYAEGARRPSLRGQHSFEGRQPDHSRPFSAPYSLDPPSHDPPGAAASYALPTGYGPPLNASPYPPSPGTTTYLPPPVPSSYSVQPSVFQQPSAYAPYAPPPGPPLSAAPRMAYYGDSPRQTSHGERPSSGDARPSMSAPSRYQPLPPPPPPPPTGYYTEPPLPAAEAYAYQQPYSQAGPSQQGQQRPNRLPTRDDSLHGQPYYPSYTQQPAIQPLVSHDAGLGLFDPAYDESPHGAAIYQPPPSTAPPVRPLAPHYHQHHSSQAPPPPLQHSHDGQQLTYPDWAFGH